MSILPTLFIDYNVCVGYLILLFIFPFLLNTICAASFNLGTHSLCLYYFAISPYFVLQFGLKFADDLSDLNIQGDWKIIPDGLTRLGTIIVSPGGSIIHKRECLFLKSWRQTNILQPLILNLFLNVTSLTLIDL